MIVGHINDIWTAIVMDIACGSHMTVSIAGTVQPIDPKYIPYTAVDITDIAERFGEESLTADIDEERIAAIEQGIEQKNLILLIKNGNQTLPCFPNITAKALEISADDGKPYKLYHIGFNIFDLPGFKSVFFLIIVTADGAKLTVYVRSLLN